MLYLGSIEIDHAIGESCYKGTILQRNYRNLTIKVKRLSFSYNSFVKFHGKKFGSHNMIMLCPNLCYNAVCYKGDSTVYIYISVY